MRMFVEEKLDWRLKAAWFLAPLPGIVAWLFLIAQLSTSWGVRAGLIMYGLLMLALVAFILALVLAAVALYLHRGEDHGDLMLAVTDRGFLLTCWSGIPISYLAISSELCRYLYLTFGGFVARSAWQWTWLGISSVVDRLFYFALPGLHSHIVGVQAITTWSRALVLALDLLLVAGIVGLALLWRAGSWASLAITEGEMSEGT